MTPLPSSNTILRAYKVRLVPTVEQRCILARICGAARAVYNWTLAEWRREYRAHRLAKEHAARTQRLLARWGSPLAADPRWTWQERMPAYERAQRALRLLRHWKSQHAKRGPYNVPHPNPAPTAMSLHKRLNAVKASVMPWLDDAPSHAIREAVLDVGEAYGHFFRRLKEGKVGREAGEPRFRSRHGRRAFHMDEGKALGVRPDGVRLQKIGWIAIHPGQRAYLPAADYDVATKTWTGAKICGIGVSEHLGEWYAAVRMEVKRPKPPPRLGGKRLGVEVGVRALVVTSDRRAVLDHRDSARLTARARRCVNSHDQRLKSAERRLALWSRRMARRYRPGAKQQSANWIEAKGHVQRVYAEIARVRDELLHYTANRVVAARAETVMMREPAVKSMIGRAGKKDEAARARNRLAPLVSKIGWYELRRKVDYKQQWAGGQFVEVPAAVETSRICSRCGVARDEAAAYPDFVCTNPACGHKEDRDDNSAKVLHDYRPPSGEPVDSGGTRRGKTGRKAGTTAERTGTPGAAGQPATTGPDRSSKGARELLARGTGRLKLDLIPTPGEPGVTSFRSKCHCRRRTRAPR